MVIEVMGSEFDEKVLKASKPVLIDFSANWCAPCVQQTPILQKWASSKGDDVTVMELDVDKAPGIATRYGVMSIPTLLLFSGGKETGRAVGIQNENALDALLAKAGN